MALQEIVIEWRDLMDWNKRTNQKDKKDVVKNRKPLAHNPTASFTMKRDEYKQMEDVRLISHFASWLSKVSGRPVADETFEQDLMDGVALCTVMSKISGSGVQRFHVMEPGSTQPLEAFKARENIQTFVAASKSLNLPVTFGTEDLEKGNIGRVASTLVFLAHCAHAQGVTVEEMDSEILDKMEQMDAALAEATNVESKTDADTVAAQELSWWQNLLVKFGLGAWINSLNLESLKAYLATLKANAEKKIEEQKQKIDEQTQLVKQKIEEKKVLVRQSSESLQSKLLEKTSSWKESLPEPIRSRLL